MLPFLTFGIRADTRKEEISHLWHSPANLWELIVSLLLPWGLGSRFKSPDHSQGT